MCQPGRPRPQGSPTPCPPSACCAFQSAKSSGSSFSSRALEPLALVHLVDVAMRERAVLGQRADAEVDVAVDRVGVAALDQRLDQRDDLGDHLGRLRLVVGPAEAEPLGVGEVVGGHLRRELGRRRPAAARRRRSCR